MIYKIEFWNHKPSMSWTAIHVKPFAILSAMDPDKLVFFFCEFIAVPKFLYYGSERVVPNEDFGNDKKNGDLSLYLYLYL